MRCDVTGPEWQLGANSEIVTTEGRDDVGLTPAHASGHGKQIGLIWNFIAQRWWHSQEVLNIIRYKLNPDILDLTRYSRDSEESKKYLLVMKLRRQIEVFSIFDNGLSTIFGGWSFVKWGELLIL